MNDVKTDLSFWVYKDRWKTANNALTHKFNVHLWDISALKDYQ